MERVRDGSGMHDRNFRFNNGSIAMLLDDPPLYVISGQSRLNREAKKPGLAALSRTLLGGIFIPGHQM
jgi:hypothetical protein